MRSRSLLALAIGLLFAPAVLAQVPAPARSGKPNVVVILADDLGTIDAHCFGAKDLDTPAIDSLAARGVRFDQFYAPAPVCSPSRAGLLTGRYPLRAGLIGNASSRPNTGPGMPGSQITIAETFKAAGYATAHVGKWHVGFMPDQLPNAQGFDLSFGHMGGCIDNYSHFFYWDGPNRHDLYLNGQEIQRPGQFFPDMMVEQASAFIEQHKAQPFFLYFALNMPHYPYQGKPEWLERYKALPYPRNLYAAFVSTLDERIGRLLKRLDDLGLRDDTIVVFQSDHGHSTEERAHFGGGSAGPYRGAKFSLFEGGIRVPAILAWPGHVPQNETRHQLGHGCDWLPTVAELAGVKLVNPDIDGKSLVAVARSADAPTPHDVVYWHVGPAKDPQWAVRQGDWKLIGNVRDTTDGHPNAPSKLTAEDKKLFLSKPTTDPAESKNLAAANPDVVQRLLKLRQDWIAAQPAAPDAPVRDRKGNER
jgi:arylsulfatase A-like enzyme